MRNRRWRWDGTGSLPLASPDASESVSAKPAWDVPPAPGAGSTTLALVTYERGSEQQITSPERTLERSERFVTQIQCVSEKAGVTIGYEVSANDLQAVTGEAPCNGEVHLDSAVPGTGEPARYTVRFTTALDSVTKAYASLVPDPDGE